MNDVLIGSVERDHKRYSYDGHGSVRQLTDASASVTDTYDYDAFGILIHRTGATPNDYLYSGEQLDANLGFYYLRACYLNPASGRFWTMDSYEGSPFDPLTLHKYLYANANPVDYVDPSGHSAFIDKLVSLSISAIVSTMSVLGRVLPAVYVLASRFAYWFFENQMKIDFWLHATEAALIFMQYSSNLILNNEEAIDMQDGNPGAFVERKVGANATGYELIDDYRDGNAMSIKTNQPDMPRLLRLIEKEAETLGNRNSDFQPGNQYPGLKPIPIADVKSRTVMVVIPETNAGFLRDPSFISAVKQIQRTTRTIVNVVPLRGWRK